MTNCFDRMTPSDLPGDRELDEQMQRAIEFDDYLEERRNQSFQTKKHGRTLSTTTPIGPPQV